MQLQYTRTYTTTNRAVNMEQQNPVIAINMTCKHVLCVPQTQTCISLTLQGMDTLVVQAPDLIVNIDNSITWGKVL